MTAEQTTWQIYDGSDEQIAEIENAQNGYILERFDGTHSSILKNYQVKYVINKFTHYWIIPDDPLREMKVRQIQTGQPVWARRYSKHYGKWVYYDGTTDPDWTLPEAEYRFTEFKD